MTISCWNIMNSSGSTEMLDRIDGSPHLEIVPVLFSLVLISSAVVGMTAVFAHGANSLTLRVQWLDPHCGYKLHVYRPPKCLRLMAPRRCCCKRRSFWFRLHLRPMCLRLSTPRHDRCHNLLTTLDLLPVLLSLVIFSWYQNN